jgi:hypothetical protein
MKDIIFIDTGSKKSDENWNLLLSKHPYAKKVTVSNSNLDNVLKIASKEAFTNTFWVIYDNVTLLPNFKLDYDVKDWDKEYVHSWKCLYNLTPVNGGVYQISKNYSNPLKFKEMGKLIGYINDKTPSSYDVFFISYYEPNAEENLNLLKERFPNVTHLSGIKGIHNAHLKAAELSTTEMFWVVDADAVLMEDFKMDYKVLPWELDTVFVWRSKNPVNELVYGYGGVKLIPKDLASKMSVDTVDMTTSISKKFKAMNKISNITNFNTDPFNTWKSAFRECVKLSSKIIEKQKDSETQRRLKIWCTVGEYMPYGKMCLAGAKAGQEYGQTYKDDPESLKKINDFNWLNEQFSKYSME